MKKAIGYVYVIAAAVCWGFLGLFNRVLTAAGVSLLNMMPLRFGGTAILFTVFCMMFKQQVFHIKLRHLPIFLGSGLISMLLVLCGCALVSGIVGSDVGISLEGLLMGLASELCYGGYTIFTHYGMRYCDSFTMAYWTFLIAGIASLFLADGSALLSALAEPRTGLPALRKSIICKGASNGLILCPQIQNHNQADFNVVMYENGLLKSAKREKNWGNRKIAKCYKYFLQRLDQDIEESGDAVKTLLEIKSKVSKAVLVKIEVGSHAEAYTLFESLNNRGTPLTAIDLMKNLILARAERSGMTCDDCFEDWQTLLGYLTDDYSTQERFFRQYYNAFKNRLNEPFRTDGQRKKDPLGYIATRSNLLSIFEELISRDLSGFMSDILVCGEI